MSYTAVKIETRLTKLQKEMAEANPPIGPRSNGDKWDKDISKVLTEECLVAEQNIQNNLKIATDTKNWAQKEMNMVETTIKNGKIDASIPKALMTIEGEIQKALATLKQDITDLTHANVEYRGSWDKTAKSILKDQSILPPYLQARNKSIDETAQTVKKCKDRCEEYVHRIPEYIKQAEHMASANKDGSVYFKELQEFTKTAQAAEKEIGELQAKAKTNVTGIQNQNSWSDADKKMVAARMVAIGPIAKAARGKMKTLELQYEGIKGRRPKGLIGFTETLDKELEKAKVHIKKAREINLAFSEQEAKCLKICKSKEVPGY